MSADRELLERAAKAAGLTVVLGKDDSDAHVLKPDAFYIRNAAGIRREWTPLTDDGDALRLAMRLGIGTHFEGHGEDDAVWADDTMLWTDGDVPAATRRAIVQAAAKRDRAPAQGAA